MAKRIVGTTDFVQINNISSEITRVGIMSPIGERRKISCTILFADRRLVVVRTQTVISACQRGGLAANSMGLLQTTRLKRFVAL